MTITYNYLVGTFEDPAESVRKMIFDKWTAANTDNERPKMYSPLGFDTSVAVTDTTKEHRHADWTKPITGDFIRFKTVNTEDVDPDSRTNAYLRKNIIVSIDVFAVNSHRLSLFLEELENIIFDNMPNTSIRVKKTNGQDSAIATFGNQSIIWTTIGDIYDSGIVRGKNTALACTIEKVKS